MPRALVVAAALTALLTAGCGSSPDPTATATIGPTAPADELHVIRSPRPSPTPTPSSTPILVPDSSLPPSGPVALRVVTDPAIAPRKLPIHLEIWQVDGGKRPGHDGTVLYARPFRAGHRDAATFRIAAPLDADAPWPYAYVLVAGYRRECKLTLTPEPNTAVRIVLTIPNSGPCRLEIDAVRPIAGS